LTAVSASAGADIPDVRNLTVGVLGGTGDQGRGLAYRFGLAGLKVLIGSRDAERAAVAAAEIGCGVRGVSNAECAAGGDVVIVAVPWEGHAALLESLRDVLVGKIVVDCVNPLGFDAQGAYALPVAEGSALQQAVTLLPQSRVVGAFHHLSAKVLIDVAVDSVDSDVLVLGDDRAATDLVQALAAIVPGMRGVYGGRARNAHQVEAFTANLVAVNRRYHAHSGVRLTGV
jgi:NADPH-dependent F420 reductase